MKASRGLVATMFMLGSVLAIPSSALAAPPNCNHGPWTAVDTGTFVGQAALAGQDVVAAAAKDENQNGFVCVNSRHATTSDKYFNTASDV